MKMTRVRMISLAVSLLSASAVYGQDFSKYREFSLGMTVAQVSKRVDARAGDVAQLFQRPAVIQEMTWWPGHAYPLPSGGESARQVLFSFYNGELYRILVRYDPDATQGLTAEDLVLAISEKYGTPARPADMINFPADRQYGSSEKVLARWEDADYSFNLFQSSANAFGLVLFTKRVDAQAATAIREALKLEQQEAPRMEMDRLKKEADVLELARQKNKKTFRP